MKLQDWANEQEPSDEMYYKSSYWSQIIFVRDHVATTLARNLDEYRNMVQVESSHISKSIICPVYYINLPHYGLQFWMRYNFYNWNISVRSEKELDCNFLNTFDDENGHGYCYCEGMQDKKFGKYQDNKKEFTICIGSNYTVYTFFMVIKDFFQIKYQSTF